MTRKEMNMFKIKVWVYAITEVMLAYGLTSLVIGIIMTITTFGMSCTSSWIEAILASNMIIGFCAVLFVAPINGILRIDDEVKNVVKKRLM